MEYFCNTLFVVHQCFFSVAVVPPKTRFQLATPHHFSSTRPSTALRQFRRNLLSNQDHRSSASLVGRAGWHMHWFLDCLICGKFFPILFKWGTNIYFYFTLTNV